MSVNLSGNQNTEQITAEMLLTAREIEVKEEFNRSIEQYKAVMSTFTPDATSDGFQTTTNSKNTTSKKKTESSDSSETDGMLKKTTSWLVDLLGINETASDEIDLSTYDELLPSFGLNKTLKEYNMTLQAMNF